MTRAYDKQPTYGRIGGGCSLQLFIQSISKTLSFYSKKNTLLLSIKLNTKSLYLIIMLHFPLLENK